MGRINSIVLLVAALGATGACKSKSSGEREATPAAAEDAAPDPFAVRVTLGDEQVATLSRAQFEARSKLQDAAPGLPAVDKWRLVTGSDGDKRRLFVQKLTKNYPDHDLLLYIGSNGEPSLGVFRDLEKTGVKKPPPHLASVAVAPKVYLRGVASIQVDVERPQSEPSKIYFALRQPGKAPIPIEADALAGLEQVSPPGGSGGAQGWSLGGALAPHLGAGKAPALHVIGTDGTVDIPAGALTSADHLLFIKINRRGEFRFRWWKLGDETELAGELRGLSAIEVR